MVPQIGTKFFVILGQFLPFDPPNNPKNQNFKKKKRHLEIYHFTLAYHHSHKKRKDIVWKHRPYWWYFLLNLKYLGLNRALKKKTLNFMAPFYRWGSTASRLQPLREGSLLFTIQFSEIPGHQNTKKWWLLLGTAQ